MADQELRDALFIASDSRSNFKNVIAKRSDQVKFAGGRLAPSLWTGVTQYPGLVLGFAATGPDAGYYKAYASGNTDGSQVAIGILSEEATPVAGGNGSEIAVIRGKGITLFQDLLIGLDAGAITALGGVSYVEHGTNLLDI